jgi:hypothetical protein
MKPLRLPIKLDNNLSLRWAVPADNDQLVELAFHALDESDENVPFVKIFVQDWVDGKFPILSYDDMTVVEDSTTGQIVSSMCLFSETWRYGDTLIKIGRPELVMTHEKHRRKGLVRKQFEIIHALSQQRGEIMQVITGIPSLYRLFGYELCLDLGGGYRIYPENFPKLTDQISGDYRLREPVSEADRIFIRELHEANTRSMLFSMDVPKSTWAFEFEGYTDGSDGKFHWLIIEDKDGEALGYVHHDHIFWGPVMDINFLAIKPGVGYLNLLPHLLHGLWYIAQQKFVDDTFNHPAEEIRGLYLRLGREHPIYNAIGQDVLLKASPYAWYVRIPDEVTYLKAVKSQLERHLSASVGAGFNGELKLNFYHRGAHLIFQDGNITIDEWQPIDGSTGDAHFPANSFWSVICGQKLASQLNDEIADCWMSRNARILLDCLFPPFNGQVWVVGGGG